MTSIAHPHDRFFKVLMGFPAAVNALLRERLPRELVEQLADAPPELIEGTFVDDRLRSSAADRLYRLRLRGGGSVLVYCLVEHKSTPDPHTALQVLGYLVHIWEKMERERGDREKLPPIIPLVVYHGARPWTVPTSFLEIVEPREKLWRRPLDFEMVIVDLEKVDDAALSQDATLRAGLLELKYSARVDVQRAKLRAILEALREVPWLLFPGLTYIIEVYGPIDRALLLREVREVMPEREEELMSLAAREWRAEGRAEGLKDGRAEGLKDGRAEGLKDGRVEGLSNALLFVLERRFGALPEAIRHRVAAGSESEVDAWLKRAIDAATLDAVFGATH